MPENLRPAGPITNQLAPWLHEATATLYQLLFEVRLDNAGTPLPSRHLNLTGLETVPTSATEVAGRSEKPEPCAGQLRTEASEAGPSSDAVEAALSRALATAADAGRFDIVGQLARELEARRLARAGNVVVLNGARRRGAHGGDP